jgi:hypothetical protein
MSNRLSDKDKEKSDAEAKVKPIFALYTKEKVKFKSEGIKTLKKSIPKKEFDKIKPEDFVCNFFASLVKHENKYYQLCIIYNIPFLKNPPTANLIFDKDSVVKLKQISETLRNTLDVKDLHVLLFDEKEMNQEEFQHKLRLWHSQIQ